MLLLIRLSGGALRGKSRVRRDSLGLILAVHILMGCGAQTPWIKEPHAPPSCLPDRPLAWEDFSIQSRKGKEAAATAVHFRVIDQNPGRLQVVLNHDLSWVRPQLVHSWNPFLSSSAARVLRHEQLHFAISCLLTREANVSLQAGGRVQDMLFLLQAVSTRMNVQYDVETNHGRDRKRQADWERAVEAQLSAGPLGERKVAVPEH